MMGNSVAKNQGAKALVKVLKSTGSAAGFGADNDNISDRRTNEDDNISERENNF